MAKYLRYYTEFLSLDGHAIRAEILQESEAPFTPVELEIGSGDSPLVIEWAETGKIEPIQGSTATLVLNSSSDRQLLHLAGVIKAGDVRLDVFRDGALWWSGTLDSEGYEESYTSASDYDVSLTFSDFGVLNRLPWGRTGRELFSVILDECLARTGIRYVRRRQYISTTHGDGTALDFTALTLDNDNFYDEDGEAMTCFDVLSGLLQPFGLRIIQRSGQIYIYDLNAAYNNIPASDVVWMGSDAMISFDAVYNDAVIHFSPYGSDKVLEGEVAVAGKTGTGTTVYTSYDNTDDERLEGFVARWGSAVEASGPALENGAVYFDVEAAYSSEDTAGILWSCKPQYREHDAITSLPQLLNAPASCFTIPTNPAAGFSGRRIATFPVQYLIATPNAAARSQYRLRINADLLFDVRYNPFEDADDGNEKANYKTMVEKCGFVWMPVMVTLRSSPGGTALYHLENASLALGTKKVSDIGEPRWVAGEGAPGCFFLAYYDHDDRSKKTGVGGWATNRRCIGYYTKSLPEAWATMPQGEYVPLPPVGGYLEISIYSGFHIRNRDIVTSIYDKVRWVAYKDVTVTLVKKNGLSIDVTDQEDIAHVNADAQEKLSLDTILGTLATTHFVGAGRRGVLEYSLLPTGKGLILRGAEQCVSFSRAGVTDRLEKLLLGTVYSQYGERKLQLSGTVGLLSGIVLGDTPRISGKFIMSSDTQDLRDDTSSAVMTELSQDDYTGIDYE